MSFWEAYFACAGGVVLSVIIPVLSKSVQQQFATGEPAAVGGALRLLRLIWRHTRRYWALALLSLAVAALIALVMGDTLSTVKAAVMAGYLWDSTLQKISGRP